jgi:AraC-like DNA-binding protein
MKELCALLDRHCRDEMTITAIPRLTLFRSAVVTSPAEVIAKPQFCVVAQGRKRILLGNQTHYYDPASYLVTSAHLPVCGEVVVAPYLGFTLALDPAMLAGLLLEMPPLADRNAPSRALAVSKLEKELLEPIVRLVRLLGEPEHLAMLAPLIEREILYRLLTGPRGEMLRHLAAPASQLSQISRAIEWIRTKYDQPVRVDELARFAGMSPPSLHRHFRAVTAMSPLQFQKRIRLHEARRRLLSESADAASVGFRVGYESPSQFSREYRRMFGAPPGRDINRVRKELISRPSSGVGIM